MAEDAGTYQVVEIYNDFEGGATITSIRDFDLTAYTDGAGYVPDTEPIDGGWGSPADASAAVIPENAQAAFDKATADLDKGELTPAALLASTASPFKFAKDVADAIGLKEEENGFEYIKAVAAKTGVLLPEGLKDLEHKEVRHTGVMKVEEMESAVREALSHK